MLDLGRRIRTQSPFSARLMEQGRLLATYGKLKICRYRKPDIVCIYILISDITDGRIHGVSGRRLFLVLHDDLASFFREGAIARCDNVY